MKLLMIGLAIAWPYFWQRSLGETTACEIAGAPPRASTRSATVSRAARSRPSSTTPRPSGQTQDGHLHGAWPDYRRTRSIPSFTCCTACGGRRERVGQERLRRHHPRQPVRRQEARADDRRHAQWLRQQGRRPREGWQRMRQGPSFSMFERPWRPGSFRSRA